MPVVVEDGLDRRLAAPIEASLYFFVSEALTNAVKHAAAGEIRVRIGIAADRLTVEIADDGVGGAAPTAGGTGLAGLARPHRRARRRASDHEPAGRRDDAARRDPVRERRGAAGVRPGAPAAAPVAADQVGAFAFDHSALWTRLAAW